MIITRNNNYNYNNNFITIIIIIINNNYIYHWVSSLLLFREFSLSLFYLQGIIMKTMYY